MVKAHRVVLGKVQWWKGEETSADLRLCLRGLRAFRAATFIYRVGRPGGMPLLWKGGEAGLFDAQHQEGACRSFRRHGSRREERPGAGGGATARGRHGVREGTPSQPRETLGGRPLVAVSGGTAARYGRLLRGTLAGDGDVQHSHTADPVGRFSPHHAGRQVLEVGGGFS